MATIKDRVIEVDEQLSVPCSGLIPDWVDYGQFRTKSSTQAGLPWLKGSRINLSGGLT